MENEIKVGEYCRTDKGYIFKVDKDKVNLEACKFLDVEYGNIVKHSPNLIDLIQCGDYVNGYLVRHITDIDTGINILCNFDLNEMRWIPLKEIDVWYEIVTHEQMESISYKVQTH